MSAKFDEFLSLPFQDIKEKPKRHRRTDTLTERRTDNVKTVYPPRPTNIVCGGGGGYKNSTVYLSDSRVILFCKVRTLGSLPIIILPRSCIFAQTSFESQFCQYYWQQGFFFIVSIYVYKNRKCMYILGVSMGFSRHDFNKIHKKHR